MLNTVLFKIPIELVPPIKTRISLLGAKIYHPVLDMLIEKISWFILGLGIIKIPGSSWV
jgi:hypothetical protein